jgi:hypothetical protein
MVAMAARERAIWEVASHCHRTNGSDRPTGSVPPAFQRSVRGVDTIRNQPSQLQALTLTKKDGRRMLSATVTSFIH